MGVFENIRFARFMDNSGCIPSIGRFTIDANSLAPPGGDLHETQHPSGLLYFSYAFVVEDSAGGYLSATDDCKINVQFRIASTTEVPNDPTVATTTNDTLKKNFIKKIFG